MLALAALGGKRSPYWVASAAAGGILLVAISEIVAVLTFKDLDLSVGIGLWLVAAAGVIGLLPSAIQSGRPSVAPPPPPT